MYSSEILAESIKASGFGDFVCFHFFVFVLFCSFDFAFNLVVGRSP